MTQNNSRPPEMTKNDAKKQSVTDRPTDQPTDRPTNRAGCRVACTRLKNKPNQATMRPLLSSDQNKFCGKNMQMIL